MMKFYKMFNGEMKIHFCGVFDNGNNFLVTHAYNDDHT